MPDISSYDSKYLIITRLKVSNCIAKGQLFVPGHGSGIDGSMMIKAVEISLSSEFFVDWMVFREARCFLRHPNNELDFENGSFYATAQLSILVPILQPSGAQAS